MVEVDLNYFSICIVLCFINLINYFIKLKYKVVEWFYIKGEMVIVDR